MELMAELANALLPEMLHAGLRCAFIILHAQLITRFCFLAQALAWHPARLRLLRCCRLSASHDANLYDIDYDAGHPDIDLLRLRNYTIGRKLSDEEVLGEPGMQRIAQLLAALFPFVSDPCSLLLTVVACGTILGRGVGRSMEPRSSDCGWSTVPQVNQDMHNLKRHQGFPMYLDGEMARLLHSSMHAAPIMLLQQCIAIVETPSQQRQRLEY